jgi:hypothetical protein
MNHDQVRVAETGHRSGLPPEPIDASRTRYRADVEEFNRHHSVQAQFSRLQHDQHPAPANLFQQLVVLP